jgi:hypothetical protein
LLFVQCCGARAARIRIILIVLEPQLDEAPMASALNLIIKSVKNYSITVFLLFPQDKILSYSHMCLLLLALKKLDCYNIVVQEPGPHRNFYLELVPHQHDAALQHYFLGLYRC